MMSIDVFIIGSKGIPAKYGGFETFVENLTKFRKRNIKYHVSCLSDNSSEFKHNNARCFNVKVPKVGSATAVLYDILSLKASIKYIKDNKLEKPIIYILASRIGPFISFFKKDLEDNNISLYLNPDGHEWKRSKWNYLVRRYWKLSERLMVKNADKIVCDSKTIQKYIKEDYYKYRPVTEFIAYGADIKTSNINNNRILEWFNKYKISTDNYYLIVGRFVPENNYELIINEFMKSDTDKDLVIITNTSNSYFSELKKKTSFQKDKRIKFVGTVYEVELLRKIRECAYAYLHGHEVGGTNPSLLEALASTNINLLLDVGFNKEVAEDAGKYFTKGSNNLSNLITVIDNLEKESIIELSSKARDRISKQYSWGKIVFEYESLFTSN
jgi:rhamnosyltransferase